MFLLRIIRRRPSANPSVWYMRKSASKTFDEISQRDVVEESLSERSLRFSVCLYVYKLIKRNWNWQKQYSPIPPPNYFVNLPSLGFELPALIRCSCTTGGRSIVNVCNTAHQSDIKTEKCKLISMRMMVGVSINVLGDGCRKIYNHRC